MAWAPGLAVALGAAVATAHGLFATAVAARVPAGLAWLYPLITDGLALVAYAATARLSGRGARYAWAVVVLAAGLSGLAQAAYLAGGPTEEVAPALRFGIGAWPAIAAAVVAHLLYLLAHPEQPDQRPGGAATVQPADGLAAVFSPGSVQSPGVQPAPLNAAPVQGLAAGTVQPRPGPVGPPHEDVVPDDPAANGPSPSSSARPVSSPARDRAEAAATRHAHRHGAWPTVTELEDAAEVSRGTAAAALKALREHPMPLHLITDTHRNPDDEAHP